VYFAHGNELKAFYRMDFMAGTCQYERIWEWHILSHPRCGKQGFSSKNYNKKG